ncbi:ArsR/SmtB family transcription factor [Paenibacillus sp. FJAT-27812]|uniref:ArsR/SmtB family transcription factor n=1 Tax=Paenibacillus sp. FJAT-27812 TaxID=1684143 RepID=UPI0006A78B0D|nr:ArsR family transcriptional regulator [Paenibacillus sp. FJAT-27812]
MLDWEEIVERLRFSYHEQIEFMSAVTIVAQFEHIKEFAREVHFSIDDELTDMVEAANASLSKHVRGEMAVFFSENMFKGKLDYVMVHVYLRHREQLGTPEDYLASYRAMPANELVSHLAAAIYSDEKMEWTMGHDWSEISKDGELLYKLAAASELSDHAEHETLLEHIRYPEEYKQRTLFLLEQFYRYAYLPIRDRLRELGEAGAEKYKALFKEKPEQAIRDVAKMDAELIDKETDIHVSYFAQVRVSIHRDDQAGQAHLVVLGVNNDAFAWQREDQETIERFLKVIADKRRLEMIELLHSKNYYGNELAQALGLTPAAISYHTNMLFDLNLIHLIKSDNRIYYELDKEKIAYYWEQTKRVLLP